jgi:hypothetical protein
MIKVNLCPVEELESPYWYVPDLAVAITVAVAGYFGVQYYLGTIQEEIDKVDQSISSLETSTKQLEPDLKKFESLDQDIQRLNEKLQALKNITVSKIERIKPLIVFEHLQNIKPLGLWYQSMDIGVPNPSTFKVAGQSFDSILTAEFMMALRSTENQDVEPSDLRTHVYFSNLALKAVTFQKGPVSGFVDLKDLPSFEITGTYADFSSKIEPNRVMDPTAKDLSSNEPDKALIQRERL